MRFAPVRGMLAAQMKPYPKPGRTGGRLIRELIQFLRQNGVQLPLDSHILIATSGGSDSMALAHLLVRYGRRVGGEQSMTLIHINHGWRGEASDEDARFVRRCAKEWGVRARVFRLKPPRKRPGETPESLEDLARRARKRIYQKLAVQENAVILTAHQADDVAETLLWRLFTGAALTHGAGILVKEGCELRPLLRVRKKDLQEYLQEEGILWREDTTNHQGRFLRSRIRQEMIPVVERLFPRAVEHLVQAALEIQQRALRALNDKSSTTTHQTDRSWDPALLFGAAGLRAKRVHWQFLQDKLKDPEWAGELHLSGGWKLSRERGAVRATPDGGRISGFERWILERLFESKN